MASTHVAAELVARQNRNGVRRIGRWSSGCRDSLLKVGLAGARRPSDRPRQSWRPGENWIGPAFAAIMFAATDWVPPSAPLLSSAAACAWLVWIIHW